MIPLIVNNNKDIQKLIQTIKLKSKKTIFVFDIRDRLPALKDGASFFVGVSRSLCDMVAIAPGESIPLQCYVAVCAKP